MLVFGDHIRTEDPRAIVSEIRTQIAALLRVPAGIERHAATVSTFLLAGELAQGLADACAIEEGCDTRVPAADLAMELAVELARAVHASWISELLARPFEMPSSLDALEATRLPPSIDIKLAEGHAYYALYPEAYAIAAASAASARPGTRRVIGIRTIGAGLAAMVSAALHAPLPSSVRPVGPPYQRKLVVADALVDEWAGGDARIAIVDEGPGMSGSSFGAVLDLLAERNVTDVECYPSHAGDLGPKASEAHRDRWNRLPRHVVDVDALLIAAPLPAHRLATWIADLVGPLVRPLRDVSAGAWRELRIADERAWPPVVEFQERRKFLATTETESWLAKFVGLGRAGTHAHDRALQLSDAGFTPSAVALRHGFSISAWEWDARCLQATRCDRAALVDRVGQYLAFRAKHFAVPRTGASLADLHAMATANAREAIGIGALALEKWLGKLAELERSVVPIEIDGRMHAWEWLVRIDGTIVKTDAVDHHASHDLVGCQDVAWDLAGAQVELCFESHEVEHASRIIADIAGRAPDPGLVAFYRVCYVAFQLGRHEHAIAMASAVEARRLRAIVERYTSQLRALL